jgi:hypothetical protein
VAVETLDSMLQEKITLDGGGWTGQHRWPRWRPLDSLPHRVVLEWMIEGGKIASRVRRGIVEVDLNSLRAYGQRSRRATMTIVNKDGAKHVKDGGDILELFKAAAEENAVTARIPLPQSQPDMFVLTLLRAAISDPRSEHYATYSSLLKKRPSNYCSINRAGKAVIVFLRWSSFDSRTAWVLTTTSDCAAYACAGAPMRA